jgi:hypothetical protein
VVHEDGDRKIEIGGRIQLQYLYSDVETEQSVDELFFRRLRPYIMGTVTENWVGKIQFDFGKAEGSNEVAVKDAWMEYSGWNNMKLRIGNTKMHFSREFLTSSKTQQLVERSFVGDHNFGSPDRVLGLRLNGNSENKKITWGIGAGVASHDPASNRIDFDTPVNKSSDWNEGLQFSGRMDYHPFGYLKMSQGDFARQQKMTVGIGAFTWSNDDDINTYTDADGNALDPNSPDLDSANGFEFSVGYRNAGWSVDGEYQTVSGDTIDSGFTGGLYADGTTKLDKYSVEGGYTLPSGKVEFVAGYDSLDADNYEDAWTRTAVGLNYFFNRHKTKVQLTYRMSDNFGGVAGADVNTGFLQFQYVF